MSQPNLGKYNFYIILLFSYAIDKVIWYHDQFSSIEILISIL